MSAIMTNSHRLPLIVVTAVCPALGTLVVLLRLYIRYFISRVGGKDDLAIATAWLASIGFTIASCLALADGTGLFGEQVSPENTEDALRTTYFVEIFYRITVFMIKLSLLLFYLRFTEGLRGYLYWSTMVVIAIVVLQFIASFVIVFVQCHPISHYWRMHEAGGCINFTAFFLSGNIFTIITDILILALPIPSLTQIKRSRKQKLGLFSIFFLGFLSTISSCVRLYTIRVYTQSDDRIYDAAPINLWSFVEVNLGLITASAPALKVLFMSLKRRDETNPRSYHLSGFRDIHSSDSRRRPSHASRLEAHLHALTNESPDSVAPDSRKSTLAKQAGQDCWGSQTRLNRPADELRSLSEHHGSGTTQDAGGERSDSRASFEFITFPSPVAVSFPAKMPQVPEIPEMSSRRSTPVPYSDIELLRRELGGNTSQMESLVETDVNTAKMHSDEYGPPDSIWILTTFDVESRRTSRRTSRDMKRTTMIV